MKMIIYWVYDSCDTLISCHKSGLLHFYLYHRKQSDDNTSDHTQTLVGTWHLDCTVNNHGYNDWELSCNCCMMSSGVELVSWRRLQQTCAEWLLVMMAMLLDDLGRVWSLHYPPPANVSPSGTRCTNWHLSPEKSHGLTFLSTTSIQFSDDPCTLCVSDLSWRDTWQ